MYAECKNRYVLSLLVDNFMQGTIFSLIIESIVFESDFRRVCIKNTEIDMDSLFRKCKIYYE